MLPHCGRTKGGYTMAEIIWNQGYTQNRELSWLEFNARVLAEAEDETVPLLERFKFLAIFTSNLDEFFMIRVGSLTDMAALEPNRRDSKSGLTASEQLDRIYAAVEPLYVRRDAAFRDVDSRLAEEDLHRISMDKLDGSERKYIKRYFETMIAPVLSPQVVDSHHPFPHLEGKVLYIAALLSHKKTERLGLIPVPASLPPLIFLPNDKRRCLMTEDIILAFADDVFEMYDVLEKTVFCVTRNADVPLDDEPFGSEQVDLRRKMEKMLRQRRRMGVVRVELSRPVSSHFKAYFRDRFEVTDAQIFLSRNAPLRMGYAFSLGDYPSHGRRSRLSDPPFTPQQPAMLPAGQSLLKAALQRDVLLSYPYESMEPFLQMIREAANDPAVLSVRITIYRLASKAKLVEYLCAAAENGKDVTVLIELRARFDEQNNIEWAERLEEAGCTVIYGSEGFKCHSKICQLTYREGMALTRLTLLGTGNFNEKTAKLYSDFMLMTAHPGIGEDANLFFRNLSLGNLRGDYRFLGVAPVGLKPLIMRGLDREIQRALAGEPARVFFKLNSLTDREVIDKIAEASCAGVRVDMIIRGISCLKPGVPGKTENVHVRSIVGRFLEHARVYAFGVDSDMIYLSSADMMTRNTEHRVEIAFPVLDPTCRALVHEYMGMQLRDNVKARSLTSDGTWVPVERKEDEKPFNSQEALLERAYRNAESAGQQRAQEKERVAEEAIQAEVEHGAVAKPEAIAAPPVNEPEAAAEPAVEKAPKVQKVQATVIEPEPAPAPQPEPQVTKPAPETSARRDKPAGKTKAIERHRPGRVRMGLGLIGLGLKTLITGKTK